MLKDKQHFWHDFCRISHPNFQTRVPASLAQFFQHIAPQFSNPRPSIFGTHFDRLSVAIFAKHIHHKFQHFWHDFCSISHPNFQTRVPASLARFLQHIASQFSNPRPSIFGTHFDRLNVTLFAKHIHHRDEIFELRCSRE